jgi:hypothetical protein
MEKQISLISYLQVRSGKAVIFASNDTSLNSRRFPNAAIGTNTKVYLGLSVCSWVSFRAFFLLL